MIRTHLVNDIDAVIELLTLKEGMQVVEQELEVVFSVPVGNDNGSTVPGITVRRPVAPPTDHEWILPLHLGERQFGRESDMDWST